MPAGKALPIGGAVEVCVDWLLDNASGVLDGVAASLGALTGGVERAFLAVPMAAFAALVVCLAAWRVSLRFAAVSAVALGAIAGMTLWPQTMSTLALVVSSAALCLLFGLPLGILSARSDRVERALRPVLDFMQTMPAFVYLIPAAMFFGLGRVPGAVATIIFAMPPGVRLTNLGIRQVPVELVEVGLAFGCTRRQLLFQVQLPTALPSIMAGVNQTIMLALSMVVIGSMIGAGGLGNEVLRGIQRLDVGLGFEGGIGVVLLAVVLDRITQSFGQRDRPSLRQRFASWRDRTRRTRWIDGGAAIIAAASLAFVVSLELRPDEGRAAPPVRRTTTARAPTGPIRIGWTAWSDAELVSRIVARLLRERLGQRTELVMADIGVQYRALADGDLDVMIMAWLPVTHAAYWKRVAGRVVDLGPLYTRARLGLVVPAYVPKSELSSIDQLAEPAVARRLRSRIQGIDPGSGLMQASERALRIYGLGRYELVSSSGAAMTAALGRAIGKHQWIVVTGWSPHWMFSRWRLRYLDDPRSAFGKRERVHALVRTGFYQDFPPEVTELLARLFFPIDELQAAMDDAASSSVRAAVDRYLSRHAERVQYWVTGELGADEASRSAKNQKARRQR